MKIVIAGAGEVGSHLAKMLSNESNERLINSPVCYGSRDSNDYENEYFEKYEFKRIKNKPTYFFETPSSSIRIKGSGAVRYLLTTEK